MIRGAFILAVGFSLGYVKAMEDNEEQEKFKDLLAQIRDSIERISDDVQNPPSEDPTSTEPQHDKPEGETPS